MNGIIALLSLLTAFFVLADTSQARAVQTKDMKQLMKESALVFVGRIQSVAPSGHIVNLTYPTWKGVIFEWSNVEVEVVEPIKGTSKGRIVRTLMLSTRGPGPIANPPGMVRPGIGQHHLLCLLPTRLGGVYASLTAPFDDRQAVILLDRKDWAGTYYKDGKKVAFQDQDEKNRALWKLVDGKGRILPDGVATIRKQYKEELAIRPPADRIIPIKWKRVTGEGGVQWNEPDEKGAGGKSWSDRELKTIPHH